MVHLNKALSVSDVITLQPFGTGHAAELFQVIQGERINLREWLPWIDNIRSEADFIHFSTGAEQRQDSGLEKSFAVAYKGRPVGRIGLYGVDHYNRLASIGYWLSREVQGMGVMTRACAEIVRYGFMDLDLNRIEIKCAAGNEKSAAIPERLKFVKEGVVRQGEFLNGSFVDLNAYAQLFSEWKAMHGNG